MEVEVIRSTKRKRTVQAYIKNGKIIVRIPNRLSKAEEHEVVESMRKRLIAKKQRDELNITGQLLERAKLLNKKYFSGKLELKSVEFVKSQKTRYGSCSIRSGEIRISESLAKAPKWTLDYVLIHEMAHLVHPDHSKAFWECVYRFPWAERAKGYLIALAREEDDTGYEI